MALRSDVETPASGEPVIRGTTVPVYVVASLAKGETVEEILEDYPYPDPRAGRERDRVREGLPEEGPPVSGPQLKADGCRYGLG
jgi:hypothetical protein